MHAQRVGAGQFDPLDPCRRYQPRDVLRIGPPPHTFAQIVGDAPGHYLKG